MAAPAQGGGVHGGNGGRSDPRAGSAVLSARVPMFLRPPATATRCYSSRPLRDADVCRMRDRRVVHAVACWYPSGHSVGRRGGDGKQLIRPSLRQQIGPAEMTEAMKREPAWKLGIQLLIFVAVLAGASSLPRCSRASDNTCGDPSGPRPPDCGAGEVAALNVDCFYCCKQAGQRCSPAVAQDTTFSNPCCSGACSDAGVCSCGGPGAPCAAASDCCSGACDTRCLAGVGAGPSGG